jgi:threonine dehydratase
MITLQDVRDARERISNFVKRTPIIHSKFLSDFCGGEVYLKLENQQITSSFKIRGALNRILRLSTEEMKKGVITASAGNHAEAVAIGAEKLNIFAKIMVPKSIPRVKIDKIKKHNVELILHGRIFDEAEEKAIELAKKNGSIYISGYNDKFVIAGNGTIGLEILEDLPNTNIIIVPVGGGGLISGISIAVKSLKQSVHIIGVQSEASPVMYESLKAGKIVDAEMRETIADGLLGGIEKGSITFGLVQKYVDELLLVKEESLRKAILLLWDKERQVTEASAAISIIPILEKKSLFKDKTTVSVLSGGNIDDELFQNIIASEYVE